MLVLNRLAQRLCGKSIVGLMFACLKTIKIHFVMYSIRPNLDGDILQLRPLLCRQRGSLFGLREIYVCATDFRVETRVNWIVL